MVFLSVCHNNIQLLPWVNVYCSYWTCTTKIFHIDQIYTVHSYHSLKGTCWIYIFPHIRPIYICAIQWHIMLINVTTIRQMKWRFDKELTTVYGDQEFWGVPHTPLTLLCTYLLWLCYSSQNNEVCAHHQHLWRFHY